MVKERLPKPKRGKKNDLKEFEGDDMTIYFDLFKQLKDQFYKEKGAKSTLETLKDSLGGSVLKDVTFFYQKLNKKSTETIVKTLKEFYALLETKPDDFFLSLITSYTIIHEKLLTTEFTRDIFINLLKIDHLIITRNRQAIKKNFRSFYPAWFLMQYEIMEDVKRLANENLDLVFPDKDKHSSAFYWSHNNYLALIQSWLSQPASQYKDINMFLDDDDCDRVHSRLLGLAFRSMDGSITLLVDSEEGDEYFLKLKNMLKFDENGNLIVELFNRMKKDFSLRAEIAHFYLTLIENNIEDFSSKQSVNTIKNFLANTDCKEPLLQKVFWANELLLEMLPGIEQKPDQFDLPKVYKRIQSILEIGGMGIGIKFFENFNSFLTKCPILNFSAFPNSKKFTGSLSDTFKQIEGFLKAYLNCLELDICKFYMGSLVSTYFDLCYEILVNCVFITRAGIADQTLYNDKDMTDALKKNIESFMDKFVDLIVLLPLDVYLEKNSPDHMSELAMGINNYKFIPKAYARFLKRVICDTQPELVIKNKDLLEKSLNKFSSSVENFSDDKKKFESFLILIDQLAKEKIESKTEAMDSLTGIIKKLFASSSQFLSNFSSSTFDSEVIEKSFSVETFVNFTKYFSNILNSESPLNQEICETLVPGVVKRLVATLSDCLDDQFELFEDEKKRLDIIHQLFLVFYIVQDWKTARGKQDFADVDEVFGKLLLHLQEIKSVDESMLLSKAANICSLIVALTPNIKPKTLLATVKSGKADLKTDSVAWAENNAATKMTSFAGLSNSAKFSEVVLQTVGLFLGVKQLSGMIFYDIAKRFAQFVPEASLLQMLAKQLTKNNTKDEYVGYKLAAIESRIVSLTEEHLVSFAYLLLGYIHESRTFPTDATIVDLEKFMDRLAIKPKNALVRSTVNLLLRPQESFGKNSQVVLSGTPVDYIVLLDFFLKKFEKDQDLEEETTQALVSAVTQPSLFTPTILSQTYPWLILKAVLSSCPAKGCLQAAFDSILQSPEQWTSLRCILAAPSCLQIVMNYELRTFLNEICSTYIIPGLLRLLESDKDQFIRFVEETIRLAVDQEMQLVYGLKRVLLQATADDLLEDEVKNLVFGSVCRTLQEAAKSVTGDRASDLVEITTNVLSYLGRSLLKSAFVQDFKKQERVKLMSYVGVTEAPEDDETSQTDIKVAFNFKITPTQFVLELALYLSLCRGTKGNKIAEFKNVGFELVDNAMFAEVKREVLLALFVRLLNISIEDGELEKFADRIPQIEQKYSEGISLCSFGAQKNLLLVAMLEFIRKVLGVLEMFSKDFEQNIHSQIMGLAVSRVQALQKAHFEANPLVAQVTTAKDYGCGFDELLVEFAETLSRFSLSQKIDIGENDLYLLLNSEVPVIQKSAFVVLLDYYETKIVPSKVFEEGDALEPQTKATELVHPELLRVLETRATALEGLQTQKQTKKKQAQEASEILEIKEKEEGKDLALFSYVLTWVQFMHRMKSPRLEGSAELKFYENLLATNPRYYFGFLNQLFKC